MKKIYSIFFLSIAWRNSFDNSFISNRKISFLIDNFSNSIYSKTKRKILFNIFDLFSYLKSSSTPLVLWNILYDSTIEARNYSSSKFNVQSFEIFSRNYIQIVIVSTRKWMCKNRSLETLCISRKNSDLPRRSKREDERGWKANIERQYELPGIKLLHVLRFRIAGHLFAFLRRVYTYTRGREKARWRKRGVRHGPITRIVPRTVNRGTHRRDDDVSREKHCERNEVRVPIVLPLSSLLSPPPSFYLLHSSSKS